jgi:hypothetical protein
MKKQLLIAMATLLPAVTLTANAMAPMDDSSAVNHDGTSLGIFYDQTTDHMTPKLTFIKKSFVGSIGFSAEKETPENADSYSKVFVPLYLGYMRNLTSQVSYSVGPGGMWSSTSEDGADNQYVYGAQMSLYYFPTENLMLSASLMPYAKEKESDGERENEYLREGSIGMSYVF